MEKTIQSGNNMKRKYSSLCVSMLSVGIESHLLTGSVTGQKIKVNTVTVETYQNGFEDASEDDWTITFE